MRTIDHLKALANRASECAKLPHCTMAVTKRVKTLPRGVRAFVAGRGSPMGEILCMPSDHTVTLAVDAIEMLAWCCAQLQKRGVPITVKVV